MHDLPNRTSTTMPPPTRVTFGPHEMDLPGDALGELRDSSSLLCSAEALRERLAEDGYLLLRGLHEPRLVESARRQMLERLDAGGALDRSCLLDEARTAEGNNGAFRGGKNELTSCHSYLALVRGPRTLKFFSFFRAGHAIAFDYE